MARRSLRDPQVQFAIARRMGKQEKLRCQKAVLRELADASATRAELVERTGFEPKDCALALDAVRIRGLVEELEAGRYGLVERSHAAGD